VEVIVEYDHNHYKVLIMEEMMVMVVEYYYKILEIIIKDNNKWLVEVMEVMLQVV
jgi:hypothetical protein